MNFWNSNQNTLHERLQKLYSINFQKQKSNEIWKLEDKNIDWSAQPQPDLNWTLCYICDTDPIKLGHLNLNFRARIFHHIFLVY